jgi:drug/metabolite transporter (DMT)-like permease
MERHSQAVGLGLAVAAAVAFGTVTIFAKVAYGAGADPLPVLAVRFLLTALILVGYLLGGRRMIKLHRERTVRLLLLGGIGYALESSLFFLALKQAPAGTVTFIFYSYPVWTTVMALAAGQERFSWRLILPLALGIGGVSFIFSFSSRGGIVGPILALSAAVAVAAYFVVAQVVAAGVPPAMSALWTSLGAGLSLTVTWLLVGGALPETTLVPVGALALATVIGFVCLFAAIERVGSARASIASTFEPVTTAILAAVFLGEVLTLRTVFGAVLMLAAIPILAGHSRSPSGAQAS